MSQWVFCQGVADTHTRTPEPCCRQCGSSIVFRFLPFGRRPPAWHSVEPHSWWHLSSELLPLMVARAGLRVMRTDMRWWNHAYSTGSRTDVLIVTRQGTGPGQELELATCGFLSLSILAACWFCMMEKAWFKILKLLNSGNAKSVRTLTSLTCILCVCACGCWMAAHPHQIFLLFFHQGGWPPYGYPLHSC